VQVCVLVLILDSMIEGHYHLVVLMNVVEFQQEQRQPSLKEGDGVVQIVVRTYCVWQQEMIYLQLQHLLVLKQSCIRHLSTKGHCATQTQKTKTPQTWGKFHTIHQKG
jgi:hypothetical protein